MASEIATTNQTISITEVTNVVVTDVVPVSDQFVREIRVFGTPVGEIEAPIFILRISSDEEGGVKVTTPTLDF